MLSKQEKKKLDFYLKEDAGKGDPTSSLIENALVKAVIISKQSCVIAGIEETAYFFKKLGCKAIARKKNGSSVKKGESVFVITGLARNVLKAERIALNFLGRMSGIASIAKKAVETGKKHGVRIACTRKTVPGFMEFDKKACLIAGMWTHRKNLGEAILVKDNHLAIEKNILGLVKKALKKKKKNKLRFVEIEVENIKDALMAVESGVDIVMLDNFSLKNAKKAIKKIRQANKKTIIELSGGIKLENLEKYCMTKPDIISLGAITRNAKILDFSLELKKV